MRWAQRGEAREQRIDEHDAPVRHDADIVDVEVAGGVGDARYVVAVGVGAVVLAWQHVLEAPDLEQRRHHEPLRVGP